MESLKSMNSQRENLHTIVLHILQSEVKAYGLSAYILSKCFPIREFLKKVSGNKNELTLSMPLEYLDIILSNKHFRVMVCDEYIELYLLGERLQEYANRWTLEFGQLEDTISE